MYLMCKDVIVARIDFSSMIFDVRRMDLMPFALRGTGVNLFTVYDWLNARVLSLSRSNAKKIISVVGLNQNNRIEICLACKGLSLTDCYWLKTEDSMDSWDSVSLYRNSLSSAVAKVALTGEYVSIQGRVKTPELTGDGTYAKCWRRCEDGLYLYKSSTVGGIECYIEVLCSDILDKLDVSHVRYTLGKTGLTPVSKCKNMTTESRCICSADYYQGYCSRNGINFMSWVQSQRSFYEMLIVDYIIYNTDRHSANWGIYFSPDTGVAECLHPLFDHNLALVVNGDIMSKVLIGKTREECARYAKSRLKLSTSELNKWLSTGSIKSRFKRIFSGVYEYDCLRERVKLYESW